jgi:hypothetical protein
MRLVLEQIHGLIFPAARCCGEDRGQCLAPTYDGLVAQMHMTNFDAPMKMPWKLAYLFVWKAGFAAEFGALLSL